MKRISIVNLQHKAQQAFSDFQTDIRIAEEMYDREDEVL